ncbi:hypothetical protein BJV77DRAFT_1001925 [Russula vinacea]|nr:hypothetical protein BJV77DRAFT_1001925 [Russula vinacea]
MGSWEMNGLHGPNHRRRDLLAGTCFEDLVGEISSLCKDQHGCSRLQKKREEGVPGHRDTIFREIFGHFADLMTGRGHRLCHAPRRAAPSPHHALTAFLAAPSPRHSSLLHFHACCARDAHRGRMSDKGVEDEVTWCWHSRSRPS